MKYWRKGKTWLKEVWRHRLNGEMAGMVLTGGIGFFLARAVIYGAFTPFGVAFLAIPLRGARMLSALIGTIAGNLSTIGKADSLRYFAASLIAVSVRYILRVFPWTRRYVFAAGVTLLSLATTGVVWLSFQGASPLSVLLLCAELLLAASAACVFACAFGTVRKRRGSFARETRMMAVLVTAALCVSSLPILKIGGVAIALGRIIACLTVIAAGYSMRLYGGVTVGLLVGLTMDLTTAVSPIYTALYALAGTTAGLCPRRQQAVPAVGYFGVIVLAIILLPQEARLYGAIYEAALATLSFSMVPKSYLALLPRTKNMRNEAHYEARLRRHMQTKLHGIAEAYEDIAKTVGDVPAEALTDETEQFAIACEMVCSSCKHWPLCCQEISRDKAAIRRMLARGFAEPEDFCTALRLRCPQLDAFCTCVTFSLRAGRERRLRSGEHAEARAVLSRQYGQIAALLDDEAVALSEDLRFERELERNVKKLAARFGVVAEVIAYRDRAGQFHVEICAPTLQPLMGRVDELTAILNQQTGARFGPPEQLEGRHLSCLSYTEQPEYACRIGATAEKRYGEAISGDCGTYFYGKNNCLYVVLCDGMGSGTAAHEEAVRTVKLLESFLKAGIEAGNAAEIIRSAAAVRSDDGQFATIDIAVVDPQRSLLQTIKYRAAPTYLRRKRGDGYAVHVLGAKSSIEPNMLVRESIKLVDGDMILLTSDGVTAACSCEEFCTCVAKLHCDHPRELSELVLKMARRDGEHDDRTVIALSYEKNRGFCIGALQTGGSVV